MTCDRRLVSYYRDGALSREERYDLESHLRECDACTTQLRAQMRLAQVVRSLPMAPVPATLRADVYRSIATREQTRRTSLGFGALGRSLAPAAVAAAVAVSALVTFRPGALDLANGSETAPAAQTTEVNSAPPSGQPAVSSGAFAASSAPIQASGVSSAKAPSSTGGSGSLVAKPPVHVPVTDSNPGNLPIKIVNPATVPEPIARLYSSNQQIRELLGAANPGSRTVTLLEQSFQGGLAIWRSDTRQIYVLRRDGNTWSVHSDAWRPKDQRVAVDGAPPPGAMVPSGGFASVWRSTPEVKSRLGWAVYEPRGSGGSIQTFERGLIVWTPHGLLYVLSNDGKWRTFPDASPL